MLQAEDGDEGDGFGSSIAVDADRLIVGAPGDDRGPSGGRGAAYVFSLDGDAWVQEAKLVASDRGEGDEFGASLAVSGDGLLVGAPKDDIGAATAQGSVYFFRRESNGWRQVTRINAPQTAAASNFGISLSLFGSRFIAGAWGDSLAGNISQGSARVFVNVAGTWQQEARLLAPDGRESDLLGASVALSSDVAAVGAVFAGDGVAGAQGDQGAVYMFRRDDSSWVHSATITANDRAALDEFGYAIALEADRLAIGAPGAAIEGRSRQGAVYLFARSGAAWVQEAKIVAENGRDGDHFGHAVALSGDALYVGAPFRDTDKGQDQGALFAFERTAAALWEPTAELTIGGLGPTARIGSAVVVAGQSAAIGANGADIATQSDRGAVVVVGSRLFYNGFESEIR